MDVSNGPMSVFTGGPYKPSPSPVPSQRSLPKTKGPQVLKNLDNAFPPFIPGASVRSVYERAGFDVNRDGPGAKKNRKKRNKNHNTGDASNNSSSALSTSSDSNSSSRANSFANSSRNFKGLTTDTSRSQSFYSHQHASANSPALTFESSFSDASTAATTPQLPAHKPFTPMSARFPHEYPPRRPSIPQPQSNSAPVTPTIPERREVRFTPDAPQIIDSDLNNHHDHDHEPASNSHHEGDAPPHAMTIPDRMDSLPQLSVPEPEIKPLSPLRNLKSSSNAPPHEEEEAPRPLLDSSFNFEETPPPPPSPPPPSQPPSNAEGLSYYDSSYEYKYNDSVDLDIDHLPLPSIQDLSRASIASSVYSLSQDPVLDSSPSSMPIPERAPRNATGIDAHVKQVNLEREINMHEQELRNNNRTSDYTTNSNYNHKPTSSSSTASSKQNSLYSVKTLSSPTSPVVSEPNTLHTVVSESLQHELPNGKTLRHSPKKMVQSRVCRGCNVKIVGKCVSSSEVPGKWHRACFVCQGCQAPFDSNEFYVFEDLPHCKDCYHDYNNSVCQGCNEGIEGECQETTTSEEGLPPIRYHPHCLACSVCDQTLHDDYYYDSTNSKALCSSHAMEFGGVLEKRRTRLMML